MVRPAALHAFGIQWVEQRRLMVPGHVALEGSSLTTPTPEIAGPTPGQRSDRANHRIKELWGPMGREVAERTADGLSRSFDRIAVEASKVGSAADDNRTARARLSALLAAVKKQLPSLQQVAQSLAHETDSAALGRLGAAICRAYDATDQHGQGAAFDAAVGDLRSVVCGSPALDEGFRAEWVRAQLPKEEARIQEHLTAKRRGCAAAHAENLARLSGRPEDQIRAVELRLQASLGSGNPGLARAEKSRQRAHLARLGLEPSAEITSLSSRIDRMPDVDLEPTPRDYAALRTSIDRGLSLLPPELRQQLDSVRRELADLGDQKAELERLKRTNADPIQLQARQEAFQAAVARMEVNNAGAESMMEAFRAELIQDSPVSREAARDLVGTLDVDPLAFTETLYFELCDAVQLTRGAPIENLRSITARGVADPYSSSATASSSGSIVDLGPTPKASELWHELGHQLEASSEPLRRIALAFVRSRAVGEPTPLEAQSPGAARAGAPAPVIYSGRFPFDYLGKVYADGSTEVLSVGLELFQSSKAMTAFCLTDPEHFALMLSALIGASARAK